MKRILLSALALIAMMAPMGASAKGYPSVVGAKTDSSPRAIQGKKGMMAMVEDDHLKFITDDSYIAVPLDEVKGWAYSTAPGDAEWTGIDGASVMPDAVVTYTGNSVELSNIGENVNVTLTALNGMTVFSLKASGACSVPLDGLQSGVYVLSFDGQTIKIAVSR